MIKLKHYGKGNDKILLLLHGEEISSWMWRESAELLSENYHCIALDLPGHGENQKTDFSIDGSVRFLLKVLQATVPEKKIHIAGVGLGGQIALKLAYEHSYLVESVILSGVVLNAKSYGFYHKLRDNYGTSVKNNQSQIKKRMKRLGIPLIRLNQFTKDVLYMKPETLKDVRREMTEFKMPEYAPTLRIPSMIMVGEHEGYDVKNSVKTIAEYFYQTQKVEVAEGKHLWMIEKPQVFSRMVTKFIEKQYLFDTLAENAKRHEIVESEAL